MCFARNEIGNFSNLVSWKNHTTTFCVNSCFYKININQQTHLTTTISVYKYVYKFQKYKVVVRLLHAKKQENKDYIFLQRLLEIQEHNGENFLLGNKTDV